MPMPAKKKTAKEPDFDRIIRVKISPSLVGIFTQIAYYHFANMLADVKPHFAFEDVEPIAGRVYSLFVEIAVFSDPKEVDYGGDYSDGGKKLGSYTVPTWFYNGFVDNLRESIANLTDLARANEAPQPTARKKSKGIEWREPHPKLIIDQFQKETKFSNDAVAEKIGCDLQTFKRIKYEPNKARSPHFETMDKLHKLIVTQTPDLFPSLTISSLYWRPKN